MSIDVPISMIGGGRDTLAPRWFIYYRVHLDDLPAVQAVVHRFQAELRSSHPALVGQLLRRQYPVDGLVTLMETYASNGDATADAALPVAIESAASVLVPWLRSERHVEEFVPCAC
jgi:Domain of unknown function (DUF4936)